MSNLAGIGKRCRELLTGTPGEVAVENRIFHAVCCITLAGVFLNILFCLSQGQAVSAVLMVFVFILLSGIYYYSRKKGKQEVSVLVYCTAGNVLCAINFFNNAGIDGPTLIIFILSFFLTISVARKTQYWFWTIFNILTVLALLIVSALYPIENVNPYADRMSRHIDWAYSYIIVVLLIVVVSLYTRKSRETDKKIAEEKAAQLEVANMTMKKLFSILAHDLRSPLVSIQGYLEVLSEEDLSPSERKKVQQALLSQTRSTSGMLTNLLSWSKNQIMGINAELCDVNIADIISETFNLYRNTAQHKDISLVNSSGEGEQIVADPEMFTLIIRNLVHNAIKFTPRGGKIEVFSFHRSDEVVIGVKDNGIGMSKEQQENIFSDDVKVSYGTGRERGAGLGLLVCKEFTLLQNGKIWFESSKESGTTFFVSFPTC